MGVPITGSYLGNKRVGMIHEPSGARIETDAPKDNGGEGALFSPTDLVAAALGSCAVTTIALYAERSGIQVQGMRFAVEKQMRTEPRRIGALPLTIYLPSTLTPEERERVERAARACPVHRSLHPEVQAELTFCYE
jgi:uncharacterized OsmC-like protein